MIVVRLAFFVIPVLAMDLFSMQIDCADKAFERIPKQLINFPKVVWQQYVGEVGKSLIVELQIKSVCTVRQINYRNSLTSVETIQ